jgi:hypothetical protein
VSDHWHWGWILDDGFRRTTGWRAKSVDEFFENQEETQFLTSNAGVRVYGEDSAQVFWVCPDPECRDGIHRRF